MKRSQMGWLLAGTGGAAALWCYTNGFAAPRKSSPVVPIAATTHTVTHTRSTHRVAIVNATSTPSRLTARSYGSSIREGLFSAPQPKADPAPVVPTVRAQTAVVPPAAPVDPLGDAEYSGSITVDGKTTALIQSRSTREGDYVAAGGQWHGLRIVSVTPQSLTVMVNGGPRTLPVSDSFNLVPLSASAVGGQPSGVPAVVATGGAMPVAPLGAADPAAYYMMRKAEAQAMREASLGLKFRAMETDHKILQLGAEK